MNFRKIRQNFISVEAVLYIIYILLLLYIYSIPSNKQ